jgi:hypothetical protein
LEKIDKAVRYDRIILANGGQAWIYPRIGGRLSRVERRSFNAAVKHCDPSRMVEGGSCNIEGPAFVNLTMSEYFSGKMK